MVLKNVKPGGKYIIRYAYHPSWKAVQNRDKLQIKSIDVLGLNFMSVYSKYNDNIVLRFGKINHFLR
jgi:hypothetical protein